MIIKDVSEAIFLAKESVNDYLVDDPRKYVFWCGAGISAGSPTNIPTANVLVPFVISKLVDDSFSEEMRTKLSKINSILSNNDIEIGTCLRLESVISEVSLIEKSLMPGYGEDLIFTKALSAFDESPYNINHHLLAKLVSLGSNVVTTNYDLCIEKALESICPNEYYRKEIKEGQYVYESEDENKGKIYHLHGIVHEPEKIGITYQTVSRPFHQDFLNELDSWLENDYYFAFLGYSCGDNYDVEKYFESHEKTNATVVAKAIYVQRREKALSKSVKRYMAFFPQSYVVVSNIDDFLKTIFKDVREISPSDCIDNFNWETAFGSRIHISSEMKSLMFSRVCKLVGIDPKMFRYYESALPMEELIRNRSPHIAEYLPRLTQFSILKEQLDPESCIKNIEDASEEYNIKYNNTYFYSNRHQYDVNEVLEINGDYETLKTSLPNVKAIESGIDDYRKQKKKIGWEFSTPIHQHTKTILNDAKEMIIDHTEAELPSDLIARASDLLYCNNILLEMDFGSFEEINQYCVSLRNRAQLLAILFGENKIEEINTCIFGSLDLYAKESSVQGVVSSMFDYSNALFILFSQSSKYDYLIYSNQIIDDLKKIQVIINNERLRDILEKEKQWRGKVLCRTETTQTLK